MPPNDQSNKPAPEECWDWLKRVVFALTPIFMLVLSGYLVFWEKQVSTKTVVVLAITIIYVIIVLFHHTLGIMVRNNKRTFELRFLGFYFKVRNEPSDE